MAARPHCDPSHVLRTRGPYVSHYLLKSHSSGFTCTLQAVVQCLPTALLPLGHLGTDNVMVG